MNKIESTQELLTAVAVCPTCNHFTKTLVFPTVGEAMESAANFTSMGYQVMVRRSPSMNGQDDSFQVESVRPTVNCDPKCVTLVLPPLKIKK